MSEAVKDALRKGLYEAPECRTVLEHLENDDVVMELGAGIGLISTLCSLKLGSSKVFAYEANPELEPQIKSVYELNRVNPELNMCMLGHSAGERDFFLTNDLTLSSSLPPGDYLKAITVPVRSFSAELERIDPSFLILDIEGGEFELLTNATFHNLRKIFVEFHPDVIGVQKCTAIVKHLKEAGFHPNQNWRRLAFEEMRSMLGQNVVNSALEFLRRRKVLPCLPVLAPIYILFKR
jgi:FkbM family methyltransferase